MDATLNIFRYADENSKPYRAQLADLLSPLLLPQEGRAPNLGPQQAHDWLDYANLDAKDDPSLGTYFGVNAADEVVVTGTLLTNYCEYRELLGIEGDRLWRCVLTYPNYRRLGHGLSLCTHMDNQIQALVNSTKSPQIHYLFTDSYPAIRIYEKTLRFKHRRDLRIVPPGEPNAGSAMVKRLYRKKYSPPPEE